MTDPNGKILIRGVNWIGDAVMTLPAIRSLRTTFKKSIISQLLRPSVLPLFEKDPNIDEFIVYDNEFKSVLGRINLSYILRKKRFASAYLFQNAFDAALIAFLAGIPQRIGYNRDGRGFLLTKPIPFKKEDRKIHHIDYYLNLLRHSGIKAEYSAPYIFQSIDEQLQSRQLLSEIRRPILGLNPGAAYGSAKRWLPDRFAEVAEWFIKDLNGSIVIFGGKNEEFIANEIQILIEKKLGFLKGFLINFAGKTSLRQLIGLISECDAIVTNDSGPMHIAYAVGTPLVAIFGSTSPELTGPPKYGNIAIRGNANCSPCFKRKCEYDYIRCMHDISSEEVYYGLKDILPNKKAVFFDRDGTLCEDADYLRSWDHFKIFPDINLLKTLKDKGFLLIGLTNQSGIARGIIEESFVKDVNKLFIERYSFDDFFYCPHHPDDKCSCRKPQLSLLFEAKMKHKVNLNWSFIVGDKESDMLLAKKAGTKGILVRTGKQTDSENADYIAKNLEDMVHYILKNEDKNPLV